MCGIISAQKLFNGLLTDSLYFNIVVIQLLIWFTTTGQEENPYAKKNYDKYLSALKNSGLVSVEEKSQGATADVALGAEGGAGAMALLGEMELLSS